VARLRIDGSHGEGGGQIVRTAVALAALSGRELEIERIRAGRPKPGLAAQHLTAVRAAAALCAAELRGDALGSQHLRFAPRREVRAGEYAFDVGEARAGGSAGAITLVVQTLLVPLALADGESRVRLRGGTHMVWSPSFDYAREVWLHALRGLGLRAELELARFGFWPAGQGELALRVEGSAGRRPAPLALERPGPLERVRGRAIAANLPAHIPQRMTDRARALLEAAGVHCEIEPLRVRAACPGAGLFLVAEYAAMRAGFDSVGERGKASETVAEEAVAALLAHRDGGAALDAHLADQLVLPLALAAGPSRVTVERATAHLATVGWLVEQFGLARIAVDLCEGGPPALCIEPAG
jgi:RNA 3'-terminal phosphate cyclase (ATP)